MKKRISTLLCLLALAMTSMQAKEKITERKQQKPLDFFIEV
jgi:hypothetical protein